MSIDGMYKIIAETPVGNVESSMTIKTDGDEVCGTFTAGKMGSIDFAGGKVEGNSFSFEMTVRKFFKKIKVCGSGKVDGSRISGEVKTSIGNSVFSGEKI